VPGGVAVGDGQKQLGPGTLGGWLQDEHEHDAKYLLSCWHCIDGDPGGKKGKDVLHPARGTKIGVISESVDPFSCAAGQTTIDACLAKVEDPDRIADFILGIGEIRGPQQVTSTYLKVRKFGVATHLTTGRVVQLRANLALQVPPGNNVKLYEKQMLIYPDAMATPFASPGDSGSLVVTDDATVTNCSKVVGLLVGGSTIPPNYIATPILDVLNKLRPGSLRFLTYP
jgi:hypothetical protein